MTDIHEAREQGQTRQNSRRRGHVVNQPRVKKPIIELVRTSIFVMHYLRKSRPSGDTPALSPTSPAELVQSLTSRKDPKALAATSSAIALSIGSAFGGPGGGTSGDGPTVQGMDAIRRTTYAAVRMAVDIAKESSDLCPPLKAVVGAMSVLMKNYDVSVSCL